MQDPLDCPEFTPAANDPLAAEHAVVARCISEASRTSAAHRKWEAIGLESLDSGRALLQAGPDEARRLLLAALAQVKYWDERINQLRVERTSNEDRLNVHRHSAWQPLQISRHYSIAVVGAFLRRSLPLETEDIARLLDWSQSLGEWNLYQSEYSSIVKALQRYAAANGIDPVLHSLMRSFAAALRSSCSRSTKRLGTLVEQLCESGFGAVTREQGPVIVKPPPTPLPAGNPLVLSQLKFHFGVSGYEADLKCIEVGPDRFQMPAASPLAAEHEKLSQLLSEIVGTRNYSTPNLPELAGGRAVLDLDHSARGRMLLAAAERHIAALLASDRNYDDTAHWQSQYAAAAIASAIVSLPAHLERDGLLDFVLYLSALSPIFPNVSDPWYDALFAGLGSVADHDPSLTEGERFVLHVWRGARIAGPPLGAPSRDIERLTEWIGDDARFYLVPGERWSDALNADLARVPAEPRSSWIALLRHMLSATSSRPSERWRKTASRQVEAIGSTEVLQSLERWLPLVASGRMLPKIPAFVGDTRASGDSIHDENAIVLRGLLWLIPLLPRRESLLRLVASVALSAYKRVPGVGPRAVKVGNAAVYALSETASPEAVGQLAMLNVRVRFGTAQKEIAKAFDAAARALGMPRDQIEEMSVPACGLEGVGRHEEMLSGYRAEVAVSGTDVDLHWSDAGGKSLRAVPSSVRRGHAETIKELQDQVKDIAAMLSAQRDRIDSLFLERKSWAEPVWRQRYLDHPVVGTLARRLIWRIAGTPAIFERGEAFNVEGDRIDVPGGAEVTLWHPAGRNIAEVVAWRRRIEKLGIVQPFKQAHREVYVLTDAERRTATYSNRFAAHILRQHQFNALCGARRWKNRLRLMVDDSFPPAIRELPAWGLRAEFWVEGIGAEYGLDCNESGVFLRLASDQIRFYRIGAARNSAHAGGGGYSTEAQDAGPGNINESIPLEEVPSLVFSEIMRDADLFVGVASIGNDPTWQDGGPGGRYRDYWYGYSFGELSATAVSRREALERLIPRLKIAGRCSLGGRFLIVRGDRRTYKIHLGSGNTLMEPNDEYLCIVPDSRARTNDPQVYLPFEGDHTLSVILSKAFLLAQDSRIVDVTINRQIDNA